MSPKTNQFFFDLGTPFPILFCHFWLIFAPQPPARGFKARGCERTIVRVHVAHTPSPVGVGVLPGWGGTPSLKILMQICSCCLKGVQCVFPLCRAGDCSRSDPPPLNPGRATDMAAPSTTRSWAGMYGNPLNPMGGWGRPPTPLLILVGFCVPSLATVSGG